MKRKLLAILSITMIAALLLSGCGGSNSSNNGEEAGNDLANKEITVILKNLTNPFWISVKEGAEAAGKELGVNVKVLAPLKADNNEEQSQMVEQAIANQTDIVVLTPSDSNGIIPAAKKLNEAGIPIINLNTKIEGNTVDVETFIAIENYDAGFQTVTRLCEMMEGKGKMIIIEGVTGAQTSIDRVKGAIAALADFPEIELVARQSGEYNRAKAMDVVQNLLQAHPDVNGIFCCNDEMALGAVEAIASAGKTGDILVAGIDANADAREAIKEGKMALSCDSQPFNQGYQGVANAVKVLQGEKLDDFIKLDMKVVGKEDL
ncbi:MAG: sugar ABC transporter substrate-binding protein [Thermoanaerobacteraceae bacterium]|mgnify:FL=1|nr:sugar ABC transporter substrate-binding protein [Thermoanaerobacteraceae bacterium]